ncbi:hypothetical protein ABT56_00595 [Photobacterium aquae]|uniref:Uncharacterized protein n=1 Tax=Photobacterium aquae TaxID=1195763 RepID=A0A0J1HDA4_9GAMM|nr:hypothetical protein [Photobacterium aquae]KLV09616.1 hypothetical protein ABT56_00595 [Photobacterium aquae]
MSYVQYLLSYSVKPCTDYECDREKANKVRSKIANITELGWFKSQNVETTFTGNFFMAEEYLTNDEKIAESKKFVRSEFIRILRECEASKYDVRIECEMMVDKIGKSFSFSITY